MLHKKITVQGVAASLVILVMLAGLLATTTNANVANGITIAALEDSGDTSQNPGNTDSNPGDTSQNPGNTDSDPGNTDSNPGNTDSGTGGGMFENPLKGIDNLCQFVDAILRVVVQIGAIIGVLMIIWTGFLFVKAQGNREGLEIAKRTLFTTLLGLAILLGSSVIARIILVTMSNIFSGGDTTCAI